MGDAEVLEFLVAGRVVVGVHLGREVAAMDRGAAEGVAVARDRVEAGFEEFFLRRLGELGEGSGGGIGEGAAEAFDGLEGVALVDDDRGDVLVGLGPAARRSGSRDRPAACPSWAYRRARRTPWARRGP